MILIPASLVVVTVPRRQVASAHRARRHGISMGRISRNCSAPWSLCWFLLRCFPHRGWRASELAPGQCGIDLALTRTVHCRACCFLVYVSGIICGAPLRRTPLCISSRLSLLDGLRLFKYRAGLVRPSALTGRFSPLWASWPLPRLGLRRCYSVSPPGGHRERAFLSSRTAAAC